MKELTVYEVRAIIMKIVEEKKLYSVYEPDVVDYAIHVSLMEIIGWKELSENPTTSLYDKEMDMYKDPQWVGGERHIWLYEEEYEEEYDNGDYHFKTAEEAVMDAAKYLLMHCVEDEPKIV